MGTETQTPLSSATLLDRHLPERRRGVRRRHIPPDWADLPTPGRQARQTLAGGTRIDRQTATANTGEKGSKHSERDKQPSYCQITKLAVYRTEPPTRFGGAVCVGPSSAVAGRSPATESDVCPPQRCDSHPNRTPGICARLPIARHRAHTAPAMPLTSAMAASFVVYPPPSHILRQDILRARKRDPPPTGADGSEDWDYPAEPRSRREPRVQKSSCLVW